jgi:hypothetical protein
MGHWGGQTGSGNPPSLSFVGLAFAERTSINAKIRQTAVFFILNLQIDDLVLNVKKSCIYRAICNKIIDLTIIPEGGRCSEVSSSKMGIDLSSGGTCCPDWAFLAGWQHEPLARDVGNRDAETGFDGVDGPTSV